ncbi:MAG: NADH-quinone oxidoreductase subunit NuoK [Candidatus Micrarchaeia archaeon]
MLLYLSIALFGIGLAGIVGGRNIIIMIFSIELIFLASIIMLGYALAISPSAAGAEMILAIWAVAALDAIVLVVLYFILERMGSKFDVKEFSTFKG